MAAVAKLFTNGRSQAVRLPAAFRLPGSEVFIRRDEITGEVILSPKPADWRGFVDAARDLRVPDDFLVPGERPAEAERDPFAGWRE